MASTPRTKEQILNDYKVIRKAAKTARSWKELVSLTGLSHSQIKTTLNYYPVVKLRINEMLQNNYFFGFCILGQKLLLPV